MRGGTCRAKREAMPCIPVRWGCAASLILGFILGVALGRDVGDVTNYEAN